MGKLDFVHFTVIGTVSVILLRYQRSFSLDLAFLCPYGRFSSDTTRFKKGKFSSMSPVIGLQGVGASTYGRRQLDTMFSLRREHLSNWNKYREDQHGPCARMTRLFYQNIQCFFAREGWTARRAASFCHWPPRRPPRCRLLSLALTDKTYTQNVGPRHAGA